MTFLQHLQKQNQGFAAPELYLVVRLLGNSVQN